MFTIVETPLYIRMVDSMLTKKEKGNLHSLISHNPEIDGVRKVRFAG